MEKENDKGEKKRKTNRGTDNCMDRRSQGEIAT